MPADTTHKAFTRVHAALIEAAQARTLLTYPDVAPVMGLPSSGNEMGRKIGDMGEVINRFERDAGRPMLSALIVKTQTMMPGDGFFICAAQLGHDIDFGDQRSMRKVWEAQRDAVYDEWEA